MKLLAILFSLYILLLPGLPCTDTDECKEASPTAMSARGEHDKHEEEACNPFCNCACCGQVFSSVFQLNKAAIVKPLVQKQQYFYKNISLSSSYFGNIWQPPKYS